MTFLNVIESLVGVLSQQLRTHFVGRDWGKKNHFHLVVYNLGKYLIKNIFFWGVLREVLWVGG